MFCALHTLRTIHPLSDSLDMDSTQSSSLWKVVPVEDGAIWTKNNCRRRSPLQEYTVKRIHEGSLLFVRLLARMLPKWIY